MRISEVLNCIGEFELVSPHGITNFNITALYHDSRQVTCGGLFFVLPGTQTSGAKFVNQAIRNGALCVVTQKNLGDIQVTQIIVPNVRKAMSLISKDFYGRACDDMRVIAIVGTNGKTTTAHILHHIIRGSGERCGIIGTLTQKLTTPDPIDLHRIFLKMRDEGITTVVMEASAHAIHFDKLAGINFFAAIFTNISCDHLDFFTTFENYCNTKINFFLQGDNIRTAIINKDNEFGQRIIQQRKGVSIGYSLEKSQLFPDRSVITLDERDFTVNLPARFNAYNALSCIICARLLNINDDHIAAALASLPRIPGRYNVFQVGGVSVVIDFAHTPDGLDKIISAVRETTKGKIITVFGCGGNRDTSKRPLMGEISARISDFTVVTSDNPRDERPIDIMRQIECGIRRLVPRAEYKARYTLIQDRTQAIHFALKKAKAGDIVIVAGKGGETHTEAKGRVTEYSDENVILKYESTHNAQPNAEV